MIRRHTRYAAHAASGNDRSFRAFSEATVPKRCVTGHITSAGPGINEDHVMSIPVGAKTYEVNRGSCPRAIAHGVHASAHR